MKEVSSCEGCHSFKFTGKTLRYCTKRAMTFHGAKSSVITNRQWCHSERGKNE